MMILVLDVQKGFETQTAECLILGEIIKKPMIVVLNKIDMIDAAKRDTIIEKVTRKVQKTLESTILARAKIIPISAKANINLVQLKDAMVQEVSNMKLDRKLHAPFIFAFDHCFQIKGSGSILSGTILQGSIKINDTIEIPQLKIERKIKSMQMFRKSVEKGESGDRLGICVTNFDAKLLERGLVCVNNCVVYSHAVIIELHQIKYFKRDIKTKAKFHCSIGHETVMGSILIFSSCHEKMFQWNSEYNYEEKVVDDPDNPRNFFALIEFEHPVLIHEKMLLIGSKLDTEATNVCRLAFYGEILIMNSSSDKNYQQTFLPRLKICKLKSRHGTINRVVNDCEVIVANLFKKETDRSKFDGMKVELSTGEQGMIAGSFGQSAKVRIQFIRPLQQSTLSQLKLPKNDVKVLLNFKKFVFDKSHKMVQ